jgi:hypothetical protein
MLTLMTGFFRANVGIQHDMEKRTEVQQGLRALFEMVTQELRQAGACLPEQGKFIALAGEDGGDADTLTLRIGKADTQTLRCIQAGTKNNVTDASTLPFATGEGTQFEGADRVYVRPNGATTSDIEGYYEVAAVSSDSVTLAEPIPGLLPQGSAVYVVDERTYKIDTLSGKQVLTETIDGRGPYPLVVGVKKFDVTYLLEPTTGGDVLTPTDEPADSGEWKRVRELTIDATVEGKDTNRDGTRSEDQGQITVKPRNLL